VGVIACDARYTTAVPAAGHRAGFFVPAYRICSRCSRLVPRISRGLCPACENRRTQERLQSEPWRAVYSTPMWRAVRAAARRRAGERCQAVVDGVRCNERRDLEAHHLTPLRAGGEPFDMDNVVVLCDDHHAALERATA
jgi:hypothetical protein